MSGLILPGGRGGSTPPPDDSSNQGQQSASGLVLPSSTTRRREQRSGEPPAVPSGAPAEAAPGGPVGAEPGPPQRARRLSAEDLAFPPTGAQVQCPNCGTPYVVPIFSIIDLGLNPELKQALLGGQVNAAICPNCGVGGPLSAPLMVHVPEKQWLGVLMPPEARLNDLQRQKVIGEMTQTLMRKLPQEQRKGYMLQPKQFADWNRFSEQLWEFEGVSAETLRRQRSQTELLQSLLGLADDRKALELALGRSGDLVDRQFFALLDRLMMLMNAQGQEGEADRFLALRNHLLELTPAGKEVAAQQERIRAVLTSITPETTREQLLDMLVDLWRQQPDGRDVGGAVIMGLPTLFDYDFLLRLSERIDQTSDPAEKQDLEQIRQMVTTAQEQVQQSRQMVVQQAQQVLQEVLGAEDAEATLRQYVDYIDEVFLSLLANSAQQAERNNSTAAARRLRSIYETALRVIEEGMPPEVQLLNRLLSAGDSKADLNTLLEENRAALTPDFIETLRRVESEMRDTGRPAMADRVKSIRAQASLKM